VTGTGLTLNLSAAARPITFKIFATNSPAGVERDGLRLPHLGSQMDFDAANLGWFFDSAAKFLLVKFQHPGGSTVITLGPDTVGDGVTDSWRAFYNISDDNADNDSDGFTNAQEYFAGTNPNDPASKFIISSVTPQPGGFDVDWPSQLGIPYRVQWKNDLLDVQWMSIVPDFVGDGNPMIWTDDGSQTGGLPIGKRFYRIAVP
jgi:hypothetical protein